MINELARRPAIVVVLPLWGGERDVPHAPLLRRWIRGRSARLDAADLAVTPKARDAIDMPICIVGRRLAAVVGALRSALRTVG